MQGGGLADRAKLRFANSSQSSIQSTTRAGESASLARGFHCDGLFLTFFFFFFFGMTR